jgi:hypothetical protein
MQSKQTINHLSRTRSLADLLFYWYCSETVTDAVAAVDAVVDVDVVADTDAVVVAVVDADGGAVLSCSTIVAVPDAVAVAVLVGSLIQTVTIGFCTNAPPQ